MVQILFEFCNFNTKMDISIFTEKSKIPTNTDLVLPLATTYELWIELYEYAFDKYPKGIES